MVEHRLLRRLQCHQCGHSMPVPDACPECQSEGTLVACGPGVERIADEIAAILPDARTAIVASDTIWSPTKAAALVSSVERSEEHTSELQSLMRISYAVFCLKKTSTEHNSTTQHTTPL